MTKGPCWAIGQFNGFPPISTNLPPLGDSNLCTNSYYFFDLCKTQQCSVSTKSLPWYTICPSQTNTIVFQIPEMGSSNVPPGRMWTSKQYEGVLAQMGPVLPSHLPDMILTSTLSPWQTCILSLVYSWQAGSIILFLLYRLIHNWNPSESSSYEAGTSECTIPLPAVIHWRSPGPIMPLWPLKSQWQNLPCCMQVTVSKPR